MNTQETVTLIQITQGAKIVAATYVTSNRGDNTMAAYHFKNVLGLPVKVGDMLVVATRDTFALVKVTDASVPHTKIGCALSDLKHVVAVVDFSLYEQAVANEAQAGDRLAMSELHERLEVYRKQLHGSTFDSVLQLLSPAQQDDSVNTAYNDAFKGKAMEQELTQPTRGRPARDMSDLGNTDDVLDTE